MCFSFFFFLTVLIYLLFCISTIFWSSPCHSQYVGSCQPANPVHYTIRLLHCAILCPTRLRFLLENLICTTRCYSKVMTLLWLRFIHVSAWRYIYYQDLFGYHVFWFLFYCYFILLLFYFILFYFKKCSFSASDVSVEPNLAQVYLIIYIYLIFNMIYKFNHKILV